MRAKPASVTITLMLRSPLGQRAAHDLAIDEMDAAFLFFLCRANGLHAGLHPV